MTKKTLQQVIWGLGKVIDCVGPNKQIMDMQEFYSMQTNCGNTTKLKLECYEYRGHD
jgi:hypothetical protein